VSHLPRADQTLFIESHLKHRCIITPYALPMKPTIANAKLSLRLILTPDEYAKPWTLYIAPGLMASVGIHAIWVTIVARGVKWLLVSYDELGKFEASNSSDLSIRALTILSLFSFISQE
jgi:hypothetical protein